MITDNTIDDTTAKYWCAFSDGKLSEILYRANTASKDKDASAVITACVKSTHKSINENWLTDFLMAKPAWADEPNGVSDVSPEGVFNDVEDGVGGYNKGTIIGIAAAPLFVAPETTLKAVESVTKAVIKHPVRTTEAVIALKAVEELAEKGWLDDVLGWCKSIGGFLMDYPVAVGAFGSIAYGLLKTYSLWWPYVRRLCYSITSGDKLAACEFESDGKSYVFEYSLGKNKWVLLQGGRLSGDIYSFVQTDFAKKFVSRCREILEPALDKAAVLKAMAGGCKDKNTRKTLNAIADNADNIRANMFRLKILAENVNKYPEETKFAQDVANSLNKNRAGVFTVDVSPQGASRVSFEF